MPRLDGEAVPGEDQNAGYVVSGRTVGETEHQDPVEEEFSTVITDDGQMGRRHNPSVLKDIGGKVIGFGVVFVGTAVAMALLTALHYCTHSGQQHGNVVVAPGNSVPQNVKMVTREPGKEQITGGPGDAAAPTPDAGTTSAGGPVPGQTKSFIEESQ